MRKISFIIFLLLSVSAVYFAYQWQDLSWRQGFLRRHGLFGGCVIWDITQTVTADGSSGRVLTWQSPELEEALELRKIRSEDSVFVGATTEPVVGEAYRLHTVRLDNLKPDTSYEFRPRFTWASLRTGNGESSKALLFSDPQDGSYNFDEKLLQPAWQQHSDADFYAILGTPAAVPGNHWSRAWRLALPGMLSSIPMAMVHGNPVVYRNSRQVELTQKLLRELPMPDNGNPNRQNQYYSFDYGAVHFVVFNTQFDETEIFQPGLQEDEMAWLEQDLAATCKKWKVVLLYKALFAFEAADGNQTPMTGFTEIGRLLMPIFDTYHVDAVIASSLHTYRRQQRLFRFASHPEGTLYIMAGASGRGLVAAQWKSHECDVAVAPMPENGSYMTLEADEKRLQFTAYALEGKAFDSIVLKKP